MGTVAIATYRPKPGRERLDGSPGMDGKPNHYPGVAEGLGQLL
jgi:hypothetical protein